MLSLQLGIAAQVSNIHGKCAVPDAPDIYTRVTHYVDWIQTTIREN